MKEYDLFDSEGKKIGKATPRGIHIPESNPWDQELGRLREKERAVHHYFHYYFARRGDEESKRWVEEYERKRRIAGSQRIRRKRRQRIVYFIGMVICARLTYVFFMNISFLFIPAGIGAIICFARMITAPH